MDFSWLPSSDFLMPANDHRQVGIERYPVAEVEKPHRHLDRVARQVSRTLLEATVDSPPFLQRAAL
jgi:hypothetical protein